MKTYLDDLKGKIAKLKITDDNKKAIWRPIGKIERELKALNLNWKER
jgi:hypothetical protein